MKRILGLDLGTNSIGWAVVTQNQDDHFANRIDCTGSRIIPMDGAALSDFERGNSVSSTAARTKFRGTRRLRERHLLRRERLHRVLNILDMLPEHYRNSIGFDRNENRTFGKFINDCDVKLPWVKNDNGSPSFIFLETYNEMLSDFRNTQPSLLIDGKRVPYDWTLYYLRKKALTLPILKEELAWIILNFNQKRGYYQLRSEEQDSEVKNAKTRQYFDTQVISSIEDSGGTFKGNKIFIVELANGNRGKLFRNEIPEWIGTEKSIIATVDIDSQGNDKYDDNGELSQRFKIPTDQEWDEKWALVKLKTESDLKESGKSVGRYIYDTLLRNPNQKIKGKLVRVIERENYKDELIAILKKQQEFHPELSDMGMLEECINDLYANNEAHRKHLSKGDIVKLIVDDIIFYQRPLKSKVHLISDCPYERRVYCIKEDNGNNIWKEEPLKCIAKSHPLYQEFRIWQFISNLRIYERERIIDGRTIFDVPATAEFLKSEDDYLALYEYLSGRANITQSDLMKYFNIKKPRSKDIPYPYRWNYVEDKSYPTNETKAIMSSRFKKAGCDTFNITSEIELHLWEILYSINDGIEIKKALKRFAERYSLPDSIIDTLKSVEFKREYGAYSAKATKKLLPLMRYGRLWSENNITDQTKERITKIINGEYDEKIPKIVYEKLAIFTSINDFKGLPLWMACYIVYGRHSESANSDKWRSPADIDNYLREFKQHSLRNPVVEQIVTETLRTVRDIWSQVGHIDEIHLELGREMKNPADKRASISRTVNENENTNHRIKLLLLELNNPEYGIVELRPSSLSHQSKMRIYEDAVINNCDKLPDDIATIIKKFDAKEVSKQPSRNEITRYKLWLEQGYRSPYTGQMIPLSKLFTTDYQIEHVIPQSRYFDDSLSNKVICEAEVNQLKDKMLGLEFIKENTGKIVELSGGRTVKMLTVEQYEENIKKLYSSSRLRSKMKKLLMDEIPDSFIERQLNDSRYISKFIQGLLSNIVREEVQAGEYEQEAISKNLIVCTGAITDRLKREWGINEVWNSIILPRFQRMNEITKSNNYVREVNNTLVPTMPFELQKGFNKKRIDHRHHAMDAIIIACTTRNHVSLLNNESARSKDSKRRYDLSRTLRHYQSKSIERNVNGEKKIVTIEVAGNFIKPWSTFTQDVHSALKNIIVSFKQNLRVINKATNYYQKIVDGKRVLCKQEGQNWAIRKSLHKDTVAGLVNLQDIVSVSTSNALSRYHRIEDRGLRREIAKLITDGVEAKKIVKQLKGRGITKIAVYIFSNETTKLYSASRKILDTSFDEKKIKSVTDSGIRKILFTHLLENENNPEVAFSADGIEQMNRDIVRLNGGKQHKPILKVRVSEVLGNKFSVGTTGAKSKKFVEADKGTNLYFAIYENSDGVRSYDSVPLNVVIENQKSGLRSVPTVNRDGDALRYELSPNDLVYIPTPEQIGIPLSIEDIDISRIYKMVSCTGNRVFFIPYSTSSVIVDKIELDSLNKMERSLTGEMIKSICIPIRVDRLGNITKLLQ